METSTIVRNVRTRTGLSQRALADVAGTSGPTIADYESGRKEPRLSTLSRIAEAGGLELELRVVPSRHERALERRRRLRLAIAAATAVRVRERWSVAQSTAHEQLDSLEVNGRGSSNARWVGQWRRAVDEGPDAVARLLLRSGEDGDDLRQVAPFAGLLSDDERRLVLAAVAAVDA